MERTRNAGAGEGRLQWLKTGGGTLTLRNKRVIKSGETFYAREDEISPAFRDTVKLLSEPLPPEVIEPVPLTYTRKWINANNFNVVDSNGKVVNTKPLRKAEADALIGELTKTE